MRVMKSMRTVMARSVSFALSPGFLLSSVFQAQYLMTRIQQRPAGIVWGLGHHANCSWFDVVALCRKSQAGANMLCTQPWKIYQNFCLGHSAGQIFENVVYGDSGSSNARFTPANSGVEGNQLIQITHWAYSSSRLGQIHCPMRVNSRGLHWIGH